MYMDRLKGLQWLQYAMFYPKLMINLDLLPNIGV